MAKPATLDGYSDQYTLDCERVLVTLLRGLGPWKDSVYLVVARPPAVPAHAGTLDVDIVIDLQILADTEAYHTLEDNLKKMGFERAENEAGRKLSWRWQTRTEHGALMVLELLADAPDIAGGKVQPLPTVGTISALNIPHSSIVFDLHQITEIQAELSDRRLAGSAGMPRGGHRVPQHQSLARGARSRRERLSQHWRRYPCAGGHHDAGCRYQHPGIDGDPGRERVRR